MGTAALVDGYQLAYVVAVGLLGVAVAIAIGVLKPLPASGDERVADLDFDQGAEPAYSEAA